ncbi:hypothetical protein FACS1894188_07350 [Clostridia bacterium]|nr:hypothetical protein FACS1894188_07350 [Clostridia bacterium]
MSFIFIMQLLCVVFTFVILVIIFRQWAQPSLKYIFFFSLCAFLMNAGVVMENFFTSFEELMFCLKIQYIGSAFFAPCFFLYCKQTSQKPIISPFVVVGVFALPIIFFVAQCLEPSVWTMHSSVTFEYSADTKSYYLATEKTTLYMLYVLYSSIILVLGSIVMIRELLNSKENKRKDIVLFIGAIVFMVVFGLIIDFAHIGKAFIPLLLQLFMVLITALLFYFSRKYRFKEWYHFGRQNAVENMRDAYILVSADGELLDANEKAYYYFPSLRTVKSGAKLIDVDGLAENLVMADVYDSITTIARGDETLALRTIRSPIVKNNELIATSIVIHDDTENYKLLQKIKLIAETDALTGLFNRGTFFEKLAHDYDLCLRNRTNGAILMMDLDHFKKINDTHGHAAGDKVLVAVAKLICSRLRHTDICGRYGGEEIVIWLPDTDDRGAVLVAESIRGHLSAAQIDIGTKKIRITSSLGIATVNHEHICTYSELISNADMALYFAKDHGRDQVQVFSYD